MFTDIPGDMPLDLGGVTVELLLSPGHTPGMIVPFIPEDRAIIIGVACDDNVLLFDPFSSSVRVYMLNLQRLIGPDGLRLDGKPGNVLYSDEKVD